MKKFLAFILAFAPAMVFAQQQLTNIDDVAQKATNIGNLVIQLAISLAVIWIIISVIRYLVVGSDAEARKAGGYAILYGVIGLVVILSIWGIVYLFSNSFKFANNQKPTREINNILITPPNRI